jgi:hypothetical protein
MNYCISVVNFNFMLSPTMCTDFYTTEFLCGYSSSGDTPCCVWVDGETSDDEGACTASFDEGTTCPYVYGNDAADKLLICEEFSGDNCL